MPLGFLRPPPTYATQRSHGVLGAGGRVAWDTQRQPWAQPLADSVRETSAWVLGKGVPMGRAI